MRHKWIASFVLIGILVLVGCQTAVTTSSPTAVANLDATTPDVTAAPTNTPVPPPTAEPKPPTNTPPPSPTPEPSATPTATPIPLIPANGIALVPFVAGFERPLYLTHAGDDRLFLIEQSGVISVIQDGRVLPQPFLDIRDRVGSWQLEQGLLGLAFHPEYARNGRFFVNYIDYSGNSHIARFQVSDDPNIADKNSELTLLTVNQPYPNHNGGLLKFGPDGYLYAGLGDGGSANDPLNNGQNPATLLGTLLRVDVDYDEPPYYAIPSNNPFVGDDGKRAEVWAYGLRNPWRFSFDRQTGDLFIADVGQNIWEGVFLQTADSTGGENYGWNIMEGGHCFLAETCDSAGLEMPIYSYQHNPHCSVTGGYMYRGTAYPDLRGNYFFGDFCSGTIWRLFETADGVWQPHQVFKLEGQISSFGEDVNGELYVIDHTNGDVWQIRPN